MKTVCAVIALCLSMVGSLQAQSQPDFSVARAVEPPVIDGALDDDVWKREALPLGEWLSYQPNRGDKMPAELRTEVKIAYDDRNIYLVIHSRRPTCGGSETLLISRLRPRVANLIGKGEQVPAIGEGQTQEKPRRLEYRSRSWSRRRGNTILG